MDGLSEKLTDKLALLPDSPGVYRMLDAQGDVIYVGKAISLKNRVRQYFQSKKNMDVKVAAMVSHISDFEYILCANETEALTLESNLIKHLQPRYNILLKDDKHFPYVRLDVRQDFPRFEVVRRVENDGAKYFGPYLSALSLKEALAAIRDFFPVRHCKKDIKKAIARGERPCLMYHLGKCCAPCSGNVTREEYHALLISVSGFLEGKTEPLIKLLEERMQSASDALDFERAAVERDRIASVRQLEASQRAIAASDTERDIFAFVRDDADAVVFALFERRGKIVGTRCMRMSCEGETEPDVMRSFLAQFYSDSGYVPREIIVKTLPADAEALEAWLGEKRGKKATLICPKRGDKLKQAEMAYTNGCDAIIKARELEHRAWERGTGALTRLTGLIGLDELPDRMECYDNSHIQGRDTVGCMVVFTGGVPDKNEYRRFRIRAEADGDDYLAMREMLNRRFSRAMEGDARFNKLPDLLVVDGGRGQLNVALAVLDEFGLSHIPAIGLAERNEEIIIPSSAEPLVLKRGDPALHVLERIRDEAHRFAISYHRSLRGKNTLHSTLMEIEGVGEKRRRILFDKFVTLDAIKTATVEELAAAPGMTRPAAQKVYAYFHADGSEKE